MTGAVLSSSGVLEHSELDEGGWKDDGGARAQGRVSELRERERERESARERVQYMCVCVDACSYIMKILRNRYEASSIKSFQKNHPSACCRQKTWYASRMSPSPAQNIIVKLFALIK